MSLRGLPDVGQSDACARCGGAFHCGVNDAEPCACATVRLDAPTLAALRERYTGCLCMRCLADIASGSGIANDLQRAP